MRWRVTLIDYGRSVMAVPRNGDRASRLESISSDPLNNVERNGTSMRDDRHRSVGNGPYYRIDCDRCDIDWVLHPYRDLYLYVVGSEVRALARRALGWCYRCGRATTVEGHGSHAEIRREAQMYTNELLKVRPPGIRGMLSDVRRIFDQTHRDLVTMLAGHETLLWCLTDVLKLRHAAPRCLECGSTSMLCIQTWASIEGGALSATHPDCGGELAVHELGEDRSANREVVLLDIEGDRIESSPDIVDRLQIGGRSVHLRAMM